MLEDYIHEGRVYLQKIKKENRDKLFVEVNQKDLRKNIFNPIYNLFKYESHFFPKRFAILGEFRIGKTELGKFIIQKFENHYKDCITLTINSKKAQEMSVKEIDDWLYTEWYTHLFQVSNVDFKTIIKNVVEQFKLERGNEPEKTLDKIYIICESYKEYCKLKPEAKFVVEFDQANVIDKEADFKPFFEFWRNFQGYWENDHYFSELPIFIFAIGHKNWMNFAALKDPIGKGVFDRWVIYEYWNNDDIEEMYKKRLLYALKLEYQDKLLEYFLCQGIVDYFGIILGKASTYEYLKQFFGKYLGDFLEDFRNNLEIYKDFLQFCKRKSKQEKVDKRYYTEVEKVFTGNPALDYMPVFRFLGDNKQENWFKDLFSLIEDIHGNNFISFESKAFRKYESFDYRFINENFTSTPATGMKPKYNPPIFTNYGKNLFLNDTFKRSLHAVEGVYTYGPVKLLKRFVESKRIERVQFIESEHGNKMEVLLEESIENSKKIFSIAQRWNIKNYLEEELLNPYYKIKELTFNLKQLYDGNSTNWAIFDNNGRQIANTLVDESIPSESIFTTKINLIAYNEIRKKIISPTTSGLPMAEYLNEILKAFGAELHSLDNGLLEGDFLSKEKLDAQPIQNRVLTVIDGPNSLGDKYQDQLDLGDVSDYTHSLDKNSDLYFITILGENKANKVKISKLGYDILESHKDIDHKVKDLIRKHLNSKNPPNIILLGAKDHDYTAFIKEIRKDFNIKIILVISSKNGLADSLKRAFSPENIKVFLKPEIDYEEDIENVYHFIEGRMGDPITYHVRGKICLPDKYAVNHPKIGEIWVCKIKNEKDTCIILTPINKIEEMESL